MKSCTVIYVPGGPPVGVLGFAEVVEDLDLAGRVADVAADGQSVLVVVDGLLVVAQVA
ncbi:MAG: hypothetical protein ACRDTH_20385 [Pseudonocardiaceae bacterium]